MIATACLVLGFILGLLTARSGLSITFYPPKGDPK